MMPSRSTLILILILMCLVDAIIPIPILGLVLIHVVFSKPPWFRELVHEIYDR